MVGVSLALAHCREEEVNTVVSSRDTRTPLHLAAALGHLAIAQILIWVRLKACPILTSVVDPNQKVLAGSESEKKVRIRIRIQTLVE
jgi:hypothetical protein